MNDDTAIFNDLSPADSNAEEFSMTLPSLDEVGWLLFGGGAFGTAISLIRERRGLADLVVPLGLMALGAGMLVRKRQARMGVAEENILAELDALDPVARAQVLKAVAKDELGRLPGVGS